MNYRQVAHRVDSLETQRSFLVSKLELLEVEISYLADHSGWKYWWKTQCA